MLDLQLNLGGANGLRRDMCTPRRGSVKTPGVGFAVPSLSGALLQAVDNRYGPNVACRPRSIRADSGDRQGVLPMINILSAIVVGLVVGALARF